MEKKKDLAKLTAALAACAAAGLTADNSDSVKAGAAACKRMEDEAQCNADLDAALKSKNAQALAAAVAAGAALGITGKLMDKAQKQLAGMGAGAASSDIFSFFFLLLASSLRVRDRSLVLRILSLFRGFPHRPWR